MTSGKSPDKMKGTDSDVLHPQQSNHDACFIPPAVRHHTGEPMYILVAYWCMQQQGWVDRNQISEAFHITARRASYVVTYLRTKTARVVCETRRIMLDNNVWRYEILVTCVKPWARKPRLPRVKPAIPRSARRVGNANSSQCNAIWNALCASRKTETGE